MVRDVVCTARTWSAQCSTRGSQAPSSHTHLGSRLVHTLRSGFCGRKSHEAQCVPCRSQYCTMCDDGQVRSGWMGASDWEVIKFFVCALWRSRKLHASICAFVTLSYQCLNRINAIDSRAGRAVTMTVTNCAPCASDVACSVQHL